MEEAKEAEPALRKPLYAEPPLDGGLSWMFLGPEGLRAGWAILVFVSLVALLIGLSESVITRVMGLRPEGALHPGRAMLGEGMLLCVSTVVTWLMATMEGKPLLSYGFQGRARLVRLVSGCVCGFAALSTLVLALWKLGYVNIAGLALSGGAAWKHAALWGFFFLLTGLFEESLFRGYLQFTLTRGIGFWWGALLVATAFALTHGSNPGESPIGLESVLGASLVFSLSLWYTGSLWWAVGFHAAWDWGQSFFFGTADSGVVAQGHLLREHPMGAPLWSGGTTGPEGSVLVFPLLAAMAVLMVVWWGRRGERPFAGAGWRGK
ncbi:MAG: CPBP family intramembrane glutamic endopeptidase [Acidobacteriaceae bacterium]|jgi:uncharacterized protein